MSYEVIEKNEYGVLVCSSFIPDNCEVCKYQENEPQNKPCKGCNLAISWYLTDQEAAKLETETDSQKELLDLQLENKQLKERIEELKIYLDKNIESCKEQEIVFKYQEMYMSEQCSSSMAIAYQNVKEFIKNKK